MPIDRPDWGPGGESRAVVPSSGGDRPAYLDYGDGRNAFPDGPRKPAPTARDIARSMPRDKKGRVIYPDWSPDKPPAMADDDGIPASLRVDGRQVLEEIETERAARGDPRHEKHLSQDRRAAMQDIAETVLHEIEPRADREWFYDEFDRMIPEPAQRALWAAATMPLDGVRVALPTPAALQTFVSLPEGAEVAKVWAGRGENVQANYGRVLHRWMTAHENLTKREWKAFTDWFDALPPAALQEVFDRLAL